jgi:hypothetical protein
LDNHFSYTGWTGSGHIKPPTAEEVEKFEALKQKANEAQDAVEAEQRKFAIRQATEKYDALAQHVTELQAKFDETWPKSSELPRHFFTVLLNEQASYPDRNYARQWLRLHDSEATAAWKTLEAAQAELSKLHRPESAPVKIESAFVQALKRCKTEEDVLNIDETALRDSLTDKTEWWDSDVRGYVRLFSQVTFFVKTLGQVAGLILSAQLQRRVAEYRDQQEQDQIAQEQDQIAKLEAELQAKRATRENG